MRDRRERRIAGGGPWILQARRYLGGGSSQPQVVQQESANKPWAGAMPYLTGGYKAAAGAYGATSKDPYAGDYYAGPTNLQTQAIGGATDWANANSNLGQGTIDMANRTIAGDYLMPGSNPALAGAIDSATRPVYENLTRTVLPGIASSAIQQGAYGGTREGITQALAGAEAGKTAGDISAGMTYQNYSDERSRQMLAPGILQQGYSMGLAPMDTLGQAGTTQQGWNQALLDQELQRWNAKQAAPWAGLQDYTAAVNGANQFSQGKTTQTTTGGGQSTGQSVISGALGGGGLGAAIGNTFAGATGAALGPWGLGGAAIGGLLGLF